VYPREVVKAALASNAASVMLAHNHPSGSPEPSESDLLLTRALIQALALVDIRILDHFIVAGQQVYSFAEHGQLWVYPMRSRVYAREYTIVKFFYSDETQCFSQVIEKAQFFRYTLVFPILECLLRVRYGTCLPSYWEEADGRQQRFPCKQQNQASFPA
jgi:hypothetical protein